MRFTPVLLLVAFPPCFGAGEVEPFQYQGQRLVLESVNFPERYFGPNFDRSLWIKKAKIIYEQTDNNDDQLFNIVSHFGGPALSVSFQSVRNPKYYITNVDGLVNLVKNPWPKNATWFITKPEISENYVHIVSTEDLGFIRHQGFRLKVTPYEDNNLYKQDASFIIVPAGCPPGMSRIVTETNTFCDCSSKCETAGSTCTAPTAENGRRRFRCQCDDGYEPDTTNPTLATLMYLIESDRWCRAIQKCERANGGCGANEICAMDQTTLEVTCEKEICKVEWAGMCGGPSAKNPINRYSDKKYSVAECHAICQADGAECDSFNVCNDQWTVTPGCCATYRSGCTKFRFDFMNYYKMDKCEWTDCDRKVYTNDVFNYTKIIDGAANLKSVWFAVDATHDIHLSLSATDPITPSSWEIALGGWGGTKSVIRKSHGGRSLVEVKHSTEQFKTWSDNFELRMSDSSVGLYDGEGNVIIRYGKFDSTGLDHLYITTGLGAYGTWRIRHGTCLTNSGEITAAEITAVEITAAEITPTATITPVVVVTSNETDHDQPGSGSLPFSFSKVLLALTLTIAITV